MIDNENENPNTQHDGPQIPYAHVREKSEKSK